MNNYAPVLWSSFALKHFRAYRLRYDGVVGWSPRCARGVRSARSLLKAQALHARANAYKGFMSASGAKRLRSRAMLLGFLSGSRVVSSPRSKRKVRFRTLFITLTAPTSVSAGVWDKRAPICLRGFLHHLSYAYGCKYYVWRAERHISGFLHYHVLIDVPVDYTAISAAWNRQLRKSGMLNDYARLHGHFHAPSTNCIPCLLMKKVSNYVSKYLAKEGLGVVPIKGRVWGMSDALRSIEWPTYLDDGYEMAGLLGEAFDNTGRVFASKHFCFIPMNGRVLSSRTELVLAKAMSEWRLSVLSPVFEVADFKVEFIKPRKVVQLDFFQ